MSFLILLSLIILNYQIYKLSQLLIVIDEQRVDITRFQNDKSSVESNNGKHWSY